MLDLFPLHDQTARVLLLGLCIEHLTLGAQAVTLGHKIVNLLTPLQDALDGLVQDDLCFIKLLLDLDDAVGLCRVLVLGDVLLKLREAHLGRALGEVGVGSARVFCDELVDDLGEDAMGDDGGVFVVGDYDTADAFCAAVGVECVLCA